jgi:protein tyrosine phosphatase (PTP) superfamily phosphohydrolase (DUF442 family)/cytochrome c556
MRRPIAALPVVLALAGCSAPTADAPTPPPTAALAAPAEAPGLHNVVAYGTGFWSGSAPEGADGFATLRAWGVRTVISVDGAEPDLALAHAAGLRYVHLPIGYNGFDEARKLQLARAVRDLPGPIYIHCHHGKHRSAGAAAAVAATLGWMSAEQAVTRMRVSGTAPGYKGLYACAATARTLTADDIDRAPKDFPECTRPDGFVAAMVEADEALDHLRAIQAAGWTTPSAHPDLVPAAEAGHLADLFRLMQADPKARARPESFQAALARTQAQAEALEAALATTSSVDVRGAAIAGPWAALAASCRDCHATCRD